MFNWISNLIGRVWDVLFPRPAPPVSEKQIGEVKYRFAFFEDRASARDAAEKNRVVAIVASGGKQKWAQMRCPCGCGEMIMLNLMQSHSPRWDVVKNQDGTHSLSPSVDSTTCGAHFWIRRDRLTWCE